jgi:hypothetical protein
MSNVHVNAKRRDTRPVFFNIPVVEQLLLSLTLAQKLLPQSHQ